MRSYSVGIILLVNLFIYACSEENPFSNSNESGSIVIYIPLENDPLNTHYPKDETNEKREFYSFLFNFIDQQGNILLSKTINKESKEESDWNHLTTLSKGLKIPYLTNKVNKICIYGNPGNALQENQLSTRLADQQKEATLYYGEIYIQSSTLEKKDSIEITLTPLVSELRINKISFVQKGKYLVNKQSGETTHINWDYFDASITGIYMNNFYNNYNQGILENLLTNKTFYQNIHNGQWIFDNPRVNATRFASYSNYLDGEYTNLSFKENEKYSFHFFPGDQLPNIHIDLKNIKTENLLSENKMVYNPENIINARFATINKYIYNGRNEMNANDFIAGKRYNINIELIPVLTDDLDIDYGIEATIEILPSADQRITMIFQ